ncbi:MAG: FIST C-terminal domain-containing protein [Colwellia sp.]
MKLRGQSVESLNYIPAFDVYKETVENLSDYRFDKKEFFDIAKHFPLGIEGIGAEILVRDPILTLNNNLQCVGNVSVNSMVHILHGKTESLIASAKNAAIKASKTSENEENKQAEQSISAAIVFDCISRVLYMEDAFSQELSAIVNSCKKEAVFGVLSLGEIANDKSGAIRLLNKSTVIGCL